MESAVEARVTYSRSSERRDLVGAVPPLSARQAHLSHVSRYWDAENRVCAAKLLPGEYFVTASAEMITTVLGYCVAACVRDRTLGIGGMNHFMLPVDRSNGASVWGGAASAATRYGNVAMERLVNDILKMGGSRQALDVKLVGGGRVLQSMSVDIGARNIDFIRKYIEQEGLRLVGEDLGDVHPRKVQYFPASGRMRVKHLPVDDEKAVVSSENSYVATFRAESLVSDVEIF